MKFLGLYLLVAALLQIGIYSTLTVSIERFAALIYFDPRIGMFFVESGLRGAELKDPGILQWLSAIWLLLIAIVLVLGHQRLKTYIISEIIASIPNLLFFVMVLLANLRPAHGFSVGELLFPIIITILFSIIPLILALRMWRNVARSRAPIPASAQ